MRKFPILISCMLIAGCVTTPAKYAATLSPKDPKWDSEDCKKIRLDALSFDDKVGGRMAIGLATGLLLGPFGIPLAAAADANQNDVRKAYSREVHLRCSSKPLPDSLKEKVPEKAQ